MNYNLKITTTKRLHIILELSINLNTILCFGIYSFFLNPSYLYIIILGKNVNKSKYSVYICTRTETYSYFNHKNMSS